MSESERKAVVRERRARGFPLHAPPHPDLGRGTYLITGATFEHRKHFRAPRELTALERRLLEAMESNSIPCAAWVVLPNHYHLLLELERARQVSRPLGSVHGRAGLYANRRDGTTGRRVWYKFSDRKVRSERHYWTCLHYVIWNPVKHGYVRDMAEWPWSSYHALGENRGPAWIEDLRRSYPLLDFGKGWDE